MSVLTHDTSTASSTAPKMTAEVVREELDLDRADDLAIFLESAEDVYADAMRYQAAARAEQYQNLQFEDIRGEEIFETLFALLQDLQERIIRHQERIVTKGGGVSSDEVTGMQRMYDDMILLRNFVSNAYQQRAEVRKQAVVSSLKLEERKKEEGQSTTKSSRQIDQPQPVAPPVEKPVDPEAEQLYVNIERLLEKTKQHVEGVKARVLQQFSSTERTELVEAALSDLDTYSGHLNNLTDRVAAARQEVYAVDVLRQTLQKYTTFTAEIVTKADALEQQLQQKKEVIMEKKEITQVSDSASNSRYEVGQLAKATVTSQTTAAEIPSEADVTMLAKRVLDEPFYTPSERSTTTLLCEAFHRAVVHNKPTATILEAYDMLRDHVRLVEERPTVTALRERAGRILKRVTAGSTFASDVLRTTRRLEHEFRAIATDPEASDERIRMAYAALVRFVRTHESDWLTVCGSPVPGVGPAGITAARTLRETLLVERDRHTEFIHDPRKQLQVDKLIRLLSSISPQGLSTVTDIPTVMSLMRVIDVPDRQGELCDQARPPVVVPNQSEQAEQPPSTEEEPPRVKHKVMDITTDDAEGSVEIRVAEKTAERIAESALQKTAREKRPEMTGAQLVSEQVAQPSRFATAHIEKHDPINVVARHKTTHPPLPAPVLEEQSLTARYLFDPRYKNFIATHYSSPAAFERMLDATVTQLEAKTVDIFERWLHEEYASPFVFLQEVPVDEVLALGADRDLRSTLAAQNIKYETFLTWLDLVPEMLAVVGDRPAMTFGELFARWMIESEMQYAASRQAVR